MKLAKVDKIVETIGWFVILSLWALTIINYHQLPEVIPSHYNETGTADDFRCKSTIFLLPAMVTVLFVTLTFIMRFIYISYNQIHTTDNNVLKQLSNAIRLIRYLKVIIAVVFGWVTYQTIRCSNDVGVWFLPLTIALLFVPIVYFIIKSFKQQ